MVLKVIPATEADVSRAVAIETTAYGPNPIGPFLYPGPFPPKSDNGLNPRCEMLLGLLRADPACRWVKVIDTDIADGEDQMVSFSMWYVWDTPQPPAPPQEWGPGANPEACEMFMGGMRKRRNARFAGKPFVCAFSVSSRSCV